MRNQRKAMHFFRSRSTYPAARESLISLDGQRKADFGCSSQIVQRMLPRRLLATSAKLFLKGPSRFRTSCTTTQPEVKVDVEMVNAVICCRTAARLSTVIVLMVSKN